MPEPRNVHRVDAVDRAGHVGTVEVPTAQAVTLTADEQVALIDTSSATGAVTVTLPPFSECVGRGSYLVRVIESSQDVTVQDSDETANPYTSDTLTAVEDFVLLLPFGADWYELKETTT